MKFLHLSDLHLGKTVHEFSMLEDQEYILKIILGIVAGEQPQAVLISGDVFDRTVAPTEALRVFDDFLNGLVRHEAKVFIISGNHDSADRLAFGSQLMERSGVHIARTYDGSIRPYQMTDEFGGIDLFLLPFLKPLHVKRFFKETAFETWTDALAVVIGGMAIEAGRRTVLLAHQFVTGADRCESEELQVGGADNVDADVFAPFDYVALGHLHGAQSVGRETIRYCGTPLKYSRSEVNHQKSVTVVELGEGAPLIRAVPLIPKRDVRELRGTYLELTARDFYQHQNVDDYIYITLTDEDDQPEALHKLRVIYKNIMHLNYDNQRTKTNSRLSDVADAATFTPIQLFGQLFREQNNRELSGIQLEYLNHAIDRIWGEAI